MNTTTFAECSSAIHQSEGTSALSYDASKLASIIQNRGSRFRLNLADCTLFQLLESYEQFKRKISPKYRNGNTQHQIKRLEEYLGMTIMPIDVCDDFYVEAFNFFSSVKNEKGKIIRPSTIKTYFSNIAATLSWACKHGAEIDPTYNVFKIPSYEQPKVALTPCQISHIYHFDLKNKENRQKLIKTMSEMKMYRYAFGLIEKVRDMFVLDCNLGQRYSDVSVFDRSNFDDTGTIFSCTQQKTGSKAKVDLSKYAIDKDITFEILRKYDYKSPAFKTSNANVNKILHALCKAIGGEFMKPISCDNKISGSIVRETKQMWQLVTSHVARRTFITYWCNRDLSVVKIQKCSGHKDVKMISRYCIDMG